MKTKSSYSSIFARWPKFSESSTASWWKPKVSRRMSKSAASGVSRSSQKNSPVASSFSTVSLLKWTSLEPWCWKTVHVAGAAGSLTRRIVLPR